MAWESGAGETRSDRLSPYLALAWALLTIIGSLYPFTGWQNTGLDPFAFLTQPWPRYWTVFDLVANVVVYAPLGFFTTLALRRLPGRLTAPILATLLGGFLSFSLESLQTWLPTRIASNVDLGCNTLGTLLGSVPAAWLGWRIHALWKLWRGRLFAPLAHLDLGLTLLGLWLLTQLSTESVLFGTGDLRPLLGEIPLFTYTPELHRLSEMAVVVSHFLAVGLFAALLFRGRWMAFLLVPLFFLLAGLMRSGGVVLVSGHEAYLNWLTPGVWEGLTLGAPLLGIALLLPEGGRRWLAILALLAGSLLLNLSPLDPYSLSGQVLWRQGQYLNFNGVIRWIAAAWPFLVLPYLLFASRRK